jgi:hypothetical protein
MQTVVSCPHQNAVPQTSGGLSPSGFGSMGAFSVISYDDAGAEFARRLLAELKAIETPQELRERAVSVYARQAEEFEGSEV